MIDIQKQITEFIGELERENLCIYNEFSLQHELGIFLRTKFPEYKVQFERNIKYFYPQVKQTTKHEIDIVVFKSDFSEKYAIELKYPRNGQYPEEMYAFTKDIAFMEEIKKLGFNETFTFTLVEDKNFYSGNFKSNNIYRFFRNNEKLIGTINKPTGNQDSKVTLFGEYEIDWKKILDGREYYLLKIK